ncbi:MAG: hypothetical protein LKE43_00460 [Olsenella sp.]|jgi:hypothetical protein|nr:hypothetical protein [Olsenella sp.]
MWPLFFLACLLLLAVLYLPGTLAFRALGLSVEDAVACSPIYGVSLIALNAMALPLLGLSASLATLAAPALALGVIAYAVAAVTRERKADKQAHELASPEASTIMVCGHSVPAWSALVAYGILGGVLCLLVFVRNLQTPEGFLQAYDNGFHLAAIRTYLSTGNFSSFSSFYYASEEAMPDMYQGGFYPSAWHGLCALVAQSTSAPETMAVNVVNASLAGVVFPTSVFFLLRRLFPGRDSVIVAGALVAPVFVCFPWDFLTWGPLYPNLLTNALVPLGVGAFTALTCPTAERGVRVRMLAVFPSRLHSRGVCPAQWHLHYGSTAGGVCRVGGHEGREECAQGWAACSGSVGSGASGLHCRWVRLGWLLQAPHAQQRGDL